MGADFRARFVEADAANARFFTPGRPDHHHFALERYVAARLEAADLASVLPLGVCTYPAENGFFSFTQTTEARLDNPNLPEEMQTYWKIVHESGLYESAEAAENDARAMTPWLNKSDPPPLVSST